MKQLFLCWVMIFSLLLAAGSCSNYLSPHQETDSPGEEMPAQEQGSQEPGIKQKEPDNNNPGASDEDEEEDGEEEEDDEPLPSENEPPEVKPPETEPTENEPPETEPPETEPTENEPPETEPPEIEPPVIPPVINLLEINELYAEYSGTTKRTEYIEFRALLSGNLNGLSLHIMYDAKKPFIYDFPAIDVASGEYITLHLRTLESDCIDELEDDLALSGGVNSCPTARDLWVSNSNKLLHRTDIVYLQDEYDRILDAVIMNETPSNTWNKNQAHFAEIAENLFNAGMWLSADGEQPTPLDAVDTSSIKTSATKSISRYEGQENTHTSNDWYVTASSSMSPGLPNK